jgi:hypothetical protein
MGINIISTVPWMLMPKGSGGREDSLMRIAFMEEPIILKKEGTTHHAMFVLGSYASSYKILEGVQAVPFEKELIKMMIDMVHLCLIESHGQVFWIHCLQHLIDRGGGYGAHNNGIDLHNLVGEDDEYRSFFGNRLPSKDDSIVVAIVIENKKRDPGDEGGYSVSWFRGGEKAGGALATVEPPSPVCIFSYQG